MTCACAACITSTAYAQESTTTPSVGSEVSETSKIDQTSTVAYRIQGSRGYIFSLSTDRTKLYSNYNTSPYTKTTIPELGSSDEDFNFVLIPSTLRDGGYYLYNVGAQKFIERSTTSDKEQLALSETPNSETFIWTITKNTFTQASASGVNRYYGTFNFPIVNDAYYLTLSNLSIAGVKTYADPDAGSRFNLIIATTNGDYTTAVQKVNTYEQSAIGEKIKAFKQNVTSSLSANIGKMGYPTQTAWETFSQTIDNATSMSQAQTALNTLLSRANLTMPEDGKAYYIRPVNRAATDRSKNRLYCDNGSLEIGVGETDNSNAIFYAHKTADFKYIFTNNAGKYLTFKAESKSINGVSNGFADEYNNYYVFTLFPMQSFSGVSGDAITSSNPTTGCLDEAGLFLLQGAMTTGRDDNHYLMANTNDKEFHNGTTTQIFYTSNNNTCAFAFEEAPQENKFTTRALTVDDVTANIATYSSPFPVVLPKEVDAYIAVSAGETIVLKKITGALPKNTGVILSAEKAKDYIPTACTTEEVASIDANNKLVASTGNAIDASTQAYVLAKNTDTDNKAVFKILSSNTDDRALAQYKAYLNLTDIQAAKLSISFNDNVTAINNATLAQEKTASIYDLSGRKSNKLQKGIYIVNGKKIIVK